jgi:hypothetical protein
LQQERIGHLVVRSSRMWTARVSIAGMMLALVASAVAGGPSRSTPNGAAAGIGHEAAAGPLRFIPDDASAALAEAKKRGVPVFVEVWAPW